MNFMRSWLPLVLLFLATVAATTEPAALSTSSSIDQILDAMDVRGRTLQDFTAGVRLSDANNATGDETISSGQIYFQRLPGDDARIRIDFDKKQLDEKIFDQHHTYTLDSGWLIERDYDKKRESQQQILKPGEKLDLFKLGQGPFPLPIGQNKDDVKAAFDVTKIDPAKDDPPGSIHVKLSPRPDSHYAHDFSSIDIWIDPATAMPLRIQTLDANQNSLRTTDLTNLNLNTGLSAKVFAEPPLPSGWDQTTEPYN
jgi:outer membrane lipoprotein-sorting protein